MQAARKRLNTEQLWHWGLSQGHLEGFPEEQEL